MIDIFTKDPDANRGAGEPNLIFGVVPVHLPRFISPWQPIIESMLFEMVIIGKCVASSISGVSVHPLLETQCLFNTSFSVNLTQGIFSSTTGSSKHVIPDSIEDFPKVHHAANSSTSTGHSTSPISSTQSWGNLWLLGEV